jgi:hypothetical protein
VSDFIGECCYFTNQNTIKNELVVTFVSFGVINLIMCFIVLLS